jgi:hypothetical protein
MRFLPGILFAGLVAVVAAGPAFSQEPPAPCECDILAASKYFTVSWQDTCPAVSRGEIEKALGRDERRKLLERMAHGIAFASQAWHLVQNNPDLKDRLEAAPIALVRHRSGRVQREEARPEPDSTLSRFQRADKVSAAKLYTVRLGDYGSEQAARTAATHWEFLSPDSKSPSPALEDSLLTITWKYSSCAGSRSPALFILPPALSSTGRHDLDFRLVLDEGDARGLATLIQQRSLAHVQVATVEVTWGVLATVLAQ